MPASADTCRVLVEGCGCHTRQLAIQRIMENMPGVQEVTILPRAQAPGDNQRYFVIKSSGESPTQEMIIAALGHRAKFYHVVSVATDAPAKVDSKPK